MKTTSTTVNTYEDLRKEVKNNLEEIKKATINKISNDLISNDDFIAKKINEFNIDLSNKKAVRTLSSFSAMLELENALKDDLKTLYASEDEEVQNYLYEVIKVAVKNIKKDCKPILDRTKEIKKAIMTNDLEKANESMQVLYNVSLSKTQFNALSSMLLTSNRKGLKVVSDNAFNNLLNHILLLRLKKSGSYTERTINGALNSAIKSVYTISYEDAITLDELTVQNCIKALGLSKRFEGDKYNYALMKDRVLRALHNSIAVQPKGFEVVE